MSAAGDVTLRMIVIRATDSQCPYHDVDYGENYRCRLGEIVEDLQIKYTAEFCLRPEPHGEKQVLAHRCQAASDLASARWMPT